MPQPSSLSVNSEDVCPKLHLYDQPIHFIENQTTRFLGERVQIPFDSKSSRITLFTKLSTMLKKVDAVPITSHQKLLLYRAAVCPRLNWESMVNQVVGNSHTGSNNHQAPEEVERPG